MGAQEILVVGGGISGLTVALEAAEVGYDVTLVEQNHYLGGRVRCPQVSATQELKKRT